MKPITEVAQAVNLGPKDFVQYGESMAKIKLDSIDSKRDGKLILVTAMSPSPAGEGKTTTSIGLTDALCKLGKNSVVALREPSMGPVFGMKGGGAGGGCAQISPAEEINLHFTGDFHAVSSAHNLLAAALDNHIHFGNSLGFDVRKPMWQRVLDVNDRSLRNVLLGLGGRLGGVPREGRFDITAASEMTAILALAKGPEDLRSRLGKIVLGENQDGELMNADKLKAVGSLMVLLKHALLPNLVQTLEGNPAIVHGGPFANIAHGTSSVLGTWAGMSRCDYVVQEAGFGADLGAEKFLNIFCRAAEVKPSAVVLVCTLRAIRFHGGVDKTKLAESNHDAVTKGMVNPLQHIENLKKFGLGVIVAINRRPEDTDADLKVAMDAFAKAGVTAVEHTAFRDGGAGAVALAESVVELADSTNGSPIKFSYETSDTIQDKIEAIASKVYGAANVDYSKAAKRQLDRLERSEYAGSHICMAKTQYSFSDDPTLVGRPKDFNMQIRELRLSAGAGFVIPVLGDMMTMPGLARVPNLEKIDINERGEAILF